MATLKLIRESKDKGLLLLGLTEEGESANYTVSVTLYEEIGCPSVGDVLDEDSVSAIKYADTRLRAKKKALSILAYADNNQRTLYSKLIRAGFCRQVASDTVDEMVALGYVNEKRQLERLILNEANVKLRGAGRIIPALVTKGYSSSAVREVLSGLVADGEIDFTKNAHSLIEKKLGDFSDEEEIRKLLYKNGFKI